MPRNISARQRVSYFTRAQITAQRYCSIAKKKKEGNRNAISHVSLAASTLSSSKKRRRRRTAIGKLKEGGKKTRIDTWKFD